MKIVLILTDTKSICIIKPSKINKFFIISSGEVYRSVVNKSIRQHLTNEEIVEFTWPYPITTFSTHRKLFTLGHVLENLKYYKQGFFRKMQLKILKFLRIHKKYRASILTI